MPSDNRPNILWICSDQQRYDTIGALGNPHIHTPNLDRLVAEGVAFTDAFCQTPICTPSRAAFLTGCYPSTVHACANGNDTWSEAAPLVTKLLADAGYDCGLVGKLHLAGACGRIEPRPKDDGYRVFHWSHHPMPDWTAGHAYHAWVAERGGNLPKLYEHPENIPPELHQTAWCADVTIDFMREARQGPWLMSVNPFDPHPPFDPPAEFLGRYNPDELPDPLFRPSDIASQSRIEADFQSVASDPDSFQAREKKAAYYAMIEQLDWNVGRMLDALEETGQRDSTIVVFTSDHGESLGDHGLLFKGCRFYEGLVHVPLIFSWPGHIQPGLRSNALVELIDIPATLLELSGQAVPPHMQARSLAPILTGSADPYHHREFVRSEYYRTLNPASRPQVEQASNVRKDNFEGSYATMIRDRRYKLVVYHGQETGELFDLDQDPGEFDNLWDNADYADIRFKLMKLSFDALAFAIDLGPEQILYY